MQLPRVVIAGVFLVIAALIAVPAVWKATSSDSRAATSETPSPSPSGDGASPAPSSSNVPSTPPGQPLTASIGGVSCPSREVRVTIRNTGSQREDYGVERNDDSGPVAGKIAARTTKTVTIRLREDRRTRVQVSWANKPVETRTLRANCKKAGGGGAPPETPPSRLPHTGPDNGVLWARAATGGAIVLTGLIIFWYGGIWPRRRERIFAKKTD
ncbi:hypothetical protein [Actinomadura terrae]|uniref:hypothetical protein n=1 Tax=Actinomadura terrae TaxID=604353 RepID=UPI001FA7A9AE|nr:hypothetical protein [Actinomadura terrae]